VTEDEAFLWFDEALIYVRGGSGNCMAMLFLLDISGSLLNVVSILIFLCPHSSSPPYNIKVVRVRILIDMASQDSISVRLVVPVVEEVT